MEFCRCMFFEIINVFKRELVYNIQFTHTQYSNPNTSIDHSLIFNFINLDHRDYTSEVLVKLFSYKNTERK